MLADHFGAHKLVYLYGLRGDPRPDKILVVRLSEGSCGGGQEINMVKSMHHLPVRHVNVVHKWNCLFHVTLN